MSRCLLSVFIVGIINIINADSTPTCSNINATSIFDKDLCGELFTPSSDGFCSARIQYAVNQFEYNSKIYPSFIVYAKCNEDIKLVLRYASQCHFKVVIRSGGHQYSGLSSCDSNEHQCIQIDMSNYDILQVLSDSDISDIPDIDKSVDDTDIIIRGGVGISNAEFANFLDVKDVFLPFGECASVHLGGHVQSGGYGHIGRIFGGILDYVIGFNIIYSNGTEKYITNTSNYDVFWAILGGNPGSFGIITYYDFIPLKNKDHSHSSAHKCYWYYDHNTLQSLLNIFYQFIEHPHLIDINYNFGLRVVSMSKNFIQFEGAFGDLDGNTTFNETWFKIFEQVGKPINCEKYINYSMSYIMKNVFTMNIYRELPFPALKATRASKTKWHRNFPSVLSQQIDKIVKTNCQKSGLFIAAQLAFISNGALYSNDANNLKTSLAHRDITSFLTTDLFYYQPINSNAKQIGINWQKENTKLFINDGLFDLNKTDYRMTWSTFGDLNISNVYRFYYDSKNNYQTYNKLRKIKTDVDKNNILSNQFTIKPLNYSYSVINVHSNVINDKHRCNANPNLCECSSIKHIGTTQKGKRLYCTKYRITRNQCVGNNKNLFLDSFVLGSPHYYCPLTVSELQNLIVSIETVETDKSLEWNIYTDDKIIGPQISTNSNYFQICVNDVIVAASGIISFNYNDSYINNYCDITHPVIPFWCQMHDLSIIGGPKMNKMLFEQYYLSIDNTFHFLEIVDVDSLIDSLYYIFNICLVLIIICVIILGGKKSKRYQAFFSNS